METFFYDAEMDTHEDDESRQARMIPADQVQPGMWIWHVGWFATSGSYEVAHVQICANGVTLLYVKVTSVLGNVFEVGLGYLPGDLVEVVK